MGHPLTLRLDDEDVAKLDEIARATDRTRSWHMARAIRAYIAHEYAFIEGVKRGIAAAEAGDIAPHEDVMAEAEAILRRKK